MLTFFTNVQVVRSIIVNNEEIVILTSDIEQLKINICLAIQQLDINGVTIPKAMIFHEQYIGIFSEGLIDFIIGHEAGHLVNNHKLSLTKLFTNEMEADDYSVMNTNTTPSQAIKYVDELFAISILNTKQWVFRMMARLERVVRITNLKLLDKKGTYERFNKSNFSA